MSVSQLSGSAPPCALKSEALVVAPDVPKNWQQIWPIIQPLKNYLLMGGSSELGVRISVWMATCGARHIVLTSRRGPEAVLYTPPHVPPESAGLTGFQRT